MLSGISASMQADRHCQMKDARAFLQPCGYQSGSAFGNGILFLIYESDALWNALLRCAKNGIRFSG